MQIVRGRASDLPYAAVGTGRPIVVFSGIWPTTGVDSDVLVRRATAPLGRLARTRRLIVLNRHPGIARGCTMQDLSAEYADFVRQVVGSPVDVLGNSTGGSIAQLVAAEHPDTVDRLVLLSSACRLSDHGRRLQATVARQLRAGHRDEAAATLAAGMVPGGMRPAARLGGRMGARWIVPGSADAADFAVTLEAEDDFDLATVPHRIEAMTLIVGGTRDRFYSPELFAETARLIPCSDLKLYRRRGHASVAGDPRARAAIARFLA